MTIKVKIPEHRPSVVRMRAQLRSGPTPMVEEPTAHLASSIAPAPSRRPLPNLPPLRLGQALRASLLILVCFGFAQLPQTERARAEKATIVASLPTAK